MAVARSCLTLWVYRILMRMFLDHPNDRTQAPVGEGSRVVQLGLAGVS